MDHLYNIAPSGPARLHTAEEIREAARDGLRLWLDMGNHHAPALCRLAANVSGWCTVVLPGGGIIQEWAGFFRLA